MPQPAESLNPEGRLPHDKTELPQANVTLPSGRVLVMRCRKAQAQVAQAGRSAMRVVARLRSKAWRNFETTRDEKPLRVVAAVAGTALVIGALLRIWRSNARE